MKTWVVVLICIIAGWVGLNVFVNLTAPFMMRRQE
jgi:hypothetical protein